MTPISRRYRPSSRTPPATSITSRRSRHRRQSQRPRVDSGHPDRPDLDSQRTAESARVGQGCVHRAVRRLPRRGHRPPDTSPHELSGDIGVDEASGRRTSEPNSFRPTHRPRASARVAAPVRLYLFIRWYVYGREALRRRPLWSRCRGGGRRPRMSVSRRR